jgi:nucleoside-diphosphate kinase
MQQIGMESNNQYCLVLIKPDGIHKGIVGEVLSQLATTGLSMIAAKLIKVSKEIAEKHYASLKERKPKIFEETIKYITGHYHTDSVLALIYAGENAITKIRDAAGVTNPEDAHPHSIRGKYGRIHSKTGVFENVVHASDSPENAETEIKLWFSPEELDNPMYPVKEETKQVTTKAWK